MVNGKKKKINKLALFSIFVAIFVAALTVFTFTFAWYVKSKSKNIGILFARPIIVEVTNRITSTSADVGEGLDDLYPGAIVALNLGFKLGGEGEKESSPAYVRGKLELQVENVLDENGNEVSWSSHVDLDESGIVTTNWVRVNFSKNGSDWWYVCRADDYAREVQNGDEVSFYNGTIELSRSLTNQVADKEIKIAFIVETLQVEGVENPLIDAKNHIVWGRD